METRPELSTSPSAGSDVQSGPMPNLMASSAQPVGGQTTQPTIPSAPQGEPKPSDEDQAKPPTDSKLAVLQRQIQALSSLQRRIPRIRSLPTHLLVFNAQSPLISFGTLSELGFGDGSGPSESDTINSILNPDVGAEANAHAREMGSQARIAFRMLNDAREESVKDVTQAALKAAHESEIVNKLDIPSYCRRMRKKRRIAAADSPAPFPAFHLEPTHTFPQPPSKFRKIQGLDDLVLFVREYNRSKFNPADQGSRTKLGLWAPSRRKSGALRCVSDPLTVRVIICDVTAVYVRLRHQNRDSAAGALSIESVVALGPREKKGPYSHSDYTVYQKLTQQIARMLEKEPDVSLPQMVDLLMSYEQLFVTPCTVCRRVLPMEGHVPPVGRVWKENSKVTVTEGERGQWEARHISCLQV